MNKATKRKLVIAAIALGIFVVFALGIVAGKRIYSRPTDDGKVTRLREDIRKLENTIILKEKEADKYKEQRDALGTKLSDLLKALEEKAKMRVAVEPPETLEEAKKVFEEEGYSPEMRYGKGGEK